MDMCVHKSRHSVLSAAVNDLLRAYRRIRINGYDMTVIDADAGRADLLSIDIHQLQIGQQQIRFPQSAGSLQLTLELFNAFFHSNIS